MLKHQLHKNIMRLNCPETIPPTSSPWKNCLPQNQSQVSKRLGTSDLDLILGASGWPEPLPSPLPQGPVSPARIPPAGSGPAPGVLPETGPPAAGLGAPAGETASCSPSARQSGPGAADGCVWEPAAFRDTCETHRHDRYPGAPSYFRAVLPFQGGAWNSVVKNFGEDFQSWLHHRLAV